MAHGNGAWKWRIGMQNRDRAWKSDIGLVPLERHINRHKDVT